MIAFDPAQQIRDGAVAAGWDDTDLWIASVALGGNLGLGDLSAITAGDRHPTRGQYEVLAAALNEQLALPGRARPVAGWQDGYELTAAARLSR